MAKDYFQDIVPPADPGKPLSIKVQTPAPEPYEESEEPVELAPAAPDRSIRNINIPARGRPMADMRSAPPPPPMPPPQQAWGRGGSRAWLWIIAGIAVLAVVILLVLFIFKKTSVNVIPQSQMVTFDQSAQFTAYPAETAAAGTIPYTVKSTDLEDSEVIQSTGTQHVETKASGSITVVNNYSNAAVKLVKNTRFSTASGLIFRVPADISIPGKSGSTSGKVTVTVAADQVGAQYNVGPQSRFTVPGLKPNAAEYANVYAYSTASTTGRSAERHGYSRGKNPCALAGKSDRVRQCPRYRCSDRAPPKLDVYQHA